MNLREMQQTQPWTAPYSRDFLSSADFGESHRWLMHDLMHVTKAVGVLSSVAEWADHGDVRHEKVDQAEYQGRIADLVMCALHMANNPPKGYEEFDLLDVVVERVDRVNKTDWNEIVRKLRSAAAFVRLRAAAKELGHDG